MLHDMKRLRWQCRRGTKELDAVLCAFLERDYATSSRAEAVFIWRVISSGR
ncbi:MAG: succinate dehydrogenase assembly factor 2 [Candidatus Methanofishera endochildressiae]|uniref:FAD assembly factor SdhE n=1 Tax=Candidatus Methanofishera endochildressiae TaxID=2738884 RepID=A0A7Z0MPB8_9GAMM|nr:succinate dehydrogenase assembly factor 2 [Candidatus Methanofishera endochildressiae]